MIIYFKIDAYDTKISVRSNETCISIFSFNDIKSSYQIEDITDDSNFDNNENKELLFKVLIEFICNLSVTFVCFVIVIIFIIIKKEKKILNVVVESLK